MHPITDVPMDCLPGNGMRRDNVNQSYGIAKT
jgi:hypothetical protein